VAVGDFNGDGTMDLAAANESSNTVSVLLGNGDGTFQAARYFAVGTSPTSVTVGDFNGDGVLDLALAHLTGNTVTVLLGNGDGTFGAPRSFNAGGRPGDRLKSLAEGDFNGDGSLDLAVTNLDSNKTPPPVGLQEMDTHVADVEYVDAVWRSAYQDRQGRQYAPTARGL
jgi:hypothetical protein